MMNSQLYRESHHQQPDSHTAHDSAPRHQMRHRNLSDTMTSIPSHSLEECDKWEAHTVTALYPYEPEKPDELFLRPGDKVHVLSNDCRLSGSEGWWVGQLDQKVGVFPASYVRDQCPQHYLPGSPSIYKPHETFISQLSTLSSMPNEDLTSMSLPMPSLSRLPSDQSSQLEKEDEIDRVLIVPREEVRQLECIGSGAFGTVYRGRWKGRRNDVALKVFNASNEQVCTEASHLLGLSHSNIIQMLGVVELSNGLALMMELAQGGALSRLIEPRPPAPLGPLPLLNLLLQVVKGMRYLHDHVKLSHRDLKTANILIREHLPQCPTEEDFFNITAVITDFGMARYISQMMSQQSKFGTVAYAAPEVCRQTIPFSLKSDVWSFGVVLWELLTFEIPFKGLEHPHLLFKIAKYNHTLYIPESFPDEFAWLLHDCWSIEPNDRPGFDEIDDRLELCRNGSFILLTVEEFQHHQSIWRDQIERQSLNEDSRNPMYCSDDVQQLIDEERAFLDRLKEHLCEREIEIHMKEQRYNEYMMNMDRQCMMLAVMTANFHGKQNQAPPPRPPRSKPFRSFFPGLRSKSNSNSSTYNGEHATGGSHPVIGPPSNLQHIVHVASNEEDDGILRIFSQIEQHQKVNTWGPSGSRTHPHVRKSVCSLTSASDGFISKSTPNLPKLSAQISQVEDLANLSGPHTPRLNNCPSCYFKALDGIETPCSQCPSDPPSRKYSASIPSPGPFPNTASGPSSTRSKKHQHRFRQQMYNSVDLPSPLPPVSPPKNRTHSLQRNLNHHGHHQSKFHKKSSSSHHTSHKMKTAEFGLHRAMNVLLAPFINNFTPKCTQPGNDKAHKHAGIFSRASSQEAGSKSRRLYQPHRQCSCDPALYPTVSQPQPVTNMWPSSTNPPRYALMKAVQDGYLQAGRHHHNEFFDNWEMVAPPGRCPASTPHTPTSPNKVKFHNRSDDESEALPVMMKAPAKRPQHIFQKCAPETDSPGEVQSCGFSIGSTDTLLDSGANRYDACHTDNHSDDTPTSRDTRADTNDQLSSAMNSLNVAPD